MESKNGRPKLKLPMSRLEIVLIIISIIAIFITWVYLIVSYDKLPETIVTHFGAAGKPDGWGNRSSIIMLPAIQSTLCILMIITLKFPHYFNFPINITEENAERQYKNARNMMLLIVLEISLVFSYIEWRSIQVAMGKVVGLGIWFLPVFLICIFSTVGYHTYRIFKLK